MFVLKEHIIWRWGDTTPVFHNKLVQIYQKKVEDLLAKYKAKNKGTCRRVDVCLLWAIAHGLHNQP